MNPGFWITLKFSLTLLSMGHKGNRCQTEYGAATWRTTWRWRRSAVSDCFSSYLFLYFEYIFFKTRKKNFTPSMRPLSIRELPPAGGPSAVSACCTKMVIIHWQTVFCSNYLATK